MSPSPFCSATIPAEGGTLSPKGKKADYKIEDWGYETPCWIWQKHRLRGYGTGSFTALGITSNWAHRVYWMVANGPIPDGYEIHHKCRIAACVNPDHLEQLPEREHDVETFLTDRAGGLTLDDVRAIRELGRTVGVRAKDVAEQYGIHEITVFNYWGQEPVWADLLGEDDPVCRPVRNCKHCGVEFSDRKRNAVYCSVAHQNAANNRKKAA